MKVVIAGGSGFIGRALTNEFSTHGWQVVVLDRHPGRRDGPETEVWDGRTFGPWVETLGDATALINLAGVSISSRWTSANRKAILDSRVESTKILGKAVERISGASHGPQVWVNASATGYYGECGEDEVTESHAPGTGFLSDVCLAWERAFKESYSSNVRQVTVRTSVVLGKGGGALAVLSKLAKGFLGGAVGSGQQWVPWIHLSDIVRFYRWCVESQVVGPVNACSPHPVRNGDLMAELRREFHRPWAPPAPSFVMRGLQVAVGFPADTVLASCCAMPAAATAHGFSFDYADLAAALKSLQ